MKIAFIIDNLYFGGAQKLVYSLINALQAKNKNIVCQVIVLDNRYNTRIEQEYISAGIELVFFQSTFKWPVFDLLRITKLAAYLKRNKFNIIHTHMGASDMVGGIAGWLAGIPTVSTIHTVTLEKETLKQKLIRYSIKIFTNRIVAVGYSVANVNEKKFSGSKIFVIPNAVTCQNPVSDNERQCIRMNLTGRDDALIYITVGRLQKQKGFEFLIDSFYVFHQRKASSKPTILVIIGDGELKPVLQSKISQYGLNDLVLLAGDRPDAPHLLFGGDVYVNSSISEGLSLALLEAMNAGLPLIATDVGEAPFLLTSDMGILLPSGDIDAMANAIEKMELDTPLRTRAGEMARETFLKEYNMDIFVERYMQVYQEIIKV